MKRSQHIALVYPHQLFNDHPAIKEADDIFLIEDPLFFRQYLFHKKKLILHRATIPLNSMEGFIRQILGWREFIHGIYHLEGASMRNSNYFSHSRAIPDCFWTADTGIPPVDETIRFLLKHGYNHHIERLMVLANFMLLCEIKPDDVYRWFMTLFVDAYDWVMVPNVYDMGLFASGGVFATKPYISSSNYIRKMSDYSKGTWAEIWDGLYWRFIDKYQSKLQNNHRMGLILAQLEKMDSDKLSAHHQIAEEFLEQI